MKFFWRISAFVMDFQLVQTQIWGFLFRGWFDAALFEKYIKFIHLLHANYLFIFFKKRKYYFHPTFCWYTIWVSNNLDLRWGSKFCGASSESKLFSKVNSLQKWPLAGKKLIEHSSAELKKIKSEEFKSGGQIRCIFSFL